MTLVLNNRKKGVVIHNEKYKSPSFRMGDPAWWKIKRFLKRIFT